jgi:ketosteroid isomerase-like protein
VDVEAIAMNKIETIRHVYDRFAKGDAAAILATFGEDIEFRLAEGHPYQPDGRPWIGGDAITQNFFVKAAADWRDWTFRVHEVIETADAVVVEGRYVAVYRPTGRTLDAQGCHVWRFRNGRIAKFHQYVDTAQVQYVMGMPAWPPHERPMAFPGVAVPPT